MLGKLIYYTIISALMLSFGWWSWSTPFFLLVAFVPLWMCVYKIERSSSKKKYLLVWALSLATFLMWNIITTYWLKNASWAAFFAAATANALIMSAVMIPTYFVVRRKGFTVGLVFWIALWVSYEKLHSTWELSWPMLTLGNGFAHYAGLVQWYEYTGVFGGSLWVLICNALIFTSWVGYIERAPKVIQYRGYILRVFVVVVPMLISWYIGSNLRLPEEKIEAIALQPNMDPYSKFSVGDKQMLDTLMMMTDTVISPKTRLVAAPETVFPDSKPIETYDNTPVFDSLRAYSKAHNEMTMIVGGVFTRYFYDKESISATANKFKGQDVWYDVYNSAIEITPTKTKIYHKSRLVPGVEIFPFKKQLGWVLGDIMMDFGGMTGSHVTQSHRTVFCSQGDSLRVAPIICYESIYSDFVAQYVRNGANVLCIITNDAWWGDTQGHLQLLSIARLRAIETRKGIIRAANTGVSAFINPKGQITSSAPYNSRVALKDQLYISNEKPTVYVAYGDYLVRPMPWLALGILLFSLLSGYKKK